MLTAVARRYLSITWELEQLEHAADAARMLCDASHLRYFATKRDAEWAPCAAAAVMTLIEQRLRLLQSALRGDVGLDVVAAHFNVTEGDRESKASLDMIPLAHRPKR
jgi:hypothetical protein